MMQRVTVAFFSFLVGILAMPAAARAGLVFEFDPNLDVSAVRAVTRTGRGFVFQSSSGSHTVALDSAVQEAVLQWVRAYKGGPVVISIDGSLVPGGAQYYPPSTPEPLGEYLLLLDSYAHQLACGSVPEGDAKQHPLLARGAMADLPDRRHKLLLSKSNQAGEAVWYRRLAGRYIVPPGCVGELTLRVRADKGAWPVRLEPSSWIHTITHQWYRDIDVPSPWDNWAARLPYKVLKQDLEQHWDSYRAALPRIDELSSIVESLAVLHALRERAPERWQELLALASPQQSEPRRPSPKLMAAPLSSAEWTALSRSWVADPIATTAQANLALSLILGDTSLDKQTKLKWVHEIQEVATRDPRLQAKFELLWTMLTPTTELAARPRQLGEFFTLLRGSFGGAFRLRAHALNRLERQHAQDPVIAANLKRQSDLLLADFMDMVKERCAAPASQSDVNDFEDLSQDVYSVGLLTRAHVQDGQHDELVRAVACIHERRGLAPQVGRELAYQHAHFRFLTYLQQHARSPVLKQEIQSSRDRMAAAIGLLDY